MRIESITIETKPKNFYNITAEVEEVVRDAGIEYGLCIIFNPSTTSFILLQEDCKLLEEDFKKLFEELASSKKLYSHPDNAHSHLLASIFSGERVIPIIDGKLALGTWQEILFYEADTKPRKREIKILLLAFLPLQMLEEEEQ
jgi:secondary thiamine-phosphate synthase enzyme